MVSYIGLGRLLAPQLGREMTIEERGRISSFEDIDENYMAEAREMAKSLVYGVAYVRYTFSLKIESEAMFFVEKVLQGGEDAKTWFDK